MAVPTVFLNYREVDVRTFARTFARSLYNRLSLNYREVDVRTCEDLRQELQVGYNLTSRFRRRACVHVVILSPRFAESEWCLRELVMMLKSKAPIIPVFYRVRAAELRWINGIRLPDFQIARDLQMLAEEQTEEGKPLYHSKEIGNWRDALFRVAHSHVAYNKGFELDTFYGESESLEKEVVKGVCKSLEKVVKKVRESLEKVEFQVWYGNPELEEVEDESLIFNF